MRNALHFAALVLITLLQGAGALRGAGSDASVLFDMEHPAGWRVGEFTSEKDQKKIPAGAAEAVEGKFGNAVKFNFARGSRGGFFMRGVKPSPAWDDADGFSFWVKGDGSRSFGGIELIDAGDFGQRFGYCFPIDSTDWRKVTVRWTDLTPELAGPAMGPKGGGGYRPGNLGNFWFGKFYYWGDFPAHSFAVDQVALEPKIPPVDPAVLNVKQEGLSRVRAKLRQKQPVTVVTMGDSLTDERHWTNRQTLWANLLVTSVKSTYGSDAKLVNPAIGGTTLSQNVILIPRWASVSSPDLVTIWFGGNDWDTGVRGDRFAEYLRLAIDRIRAATGGRADILVMTTNPTHDRWETYKELEAAAKWVAKEKGVALTDVAATLREAGKTPEAALKAEFWATDKVHLGIRGHELARDVVLAAIESSK